MKVCIKEKLNHIPHLNDFLDERNLEMEVGDQMECVAFTNRQEFEAIERKYPILIRDVIVILVYIWHEMLPKMDLTRKFYFFLTGERHRTYRGKDGRWIEVYKFRTMHSYSQYLQDYVYEKNKLDQSGKLANDFRVNVWGRILRPIWMDELPMLWNVVQGDMKWVGVRPLTEHFFSLYTPEMQRLRTKVRPGMLPPFYYERHTPKGLDEIQASERRYIESYLVHPFVTDWRYFWGTVYNILIKMKRSK